jgi:hypothetical protein
MLLLADMVAFRSKSSKIHMLMVSPLTGHLTPRHPHYSLYYSNEFDAVPVNVTAQFAGPCDALWELAHRWRSIRLVSLSEPIVRRFLKRLQACSDLSSLDTLCLEAVRVGSTIYDARREREPSPGLDFTLFTAPLPKLKSVSVCRFAVVPVLAAESSTGHSGAEIALARRHLFTSILSKLLYLRLTSIDASVHNWAASLRPCRSLRVLVISGGQVSSSRALPPALHVPLPELEALGLESTSAGTMHFAALSLEMPKLKVLHLDFPDDQFDHPIFYRPAARCLDALVRTISLCNPCSN